MLPQLNLKLLTYLDGGQASDAMDWNTGWDVPRQVKDYHDLSLNSSPVFASPPLNDPGSSQNIYNQFDCYIPPQQNIFPQTGYEGIALKLTDFKSITDGNAITPLYQMNLKSSNLDYNMKELKFANQIQIPIKYIFLSQEPYLAGGEEEPYPNDCFGTVQKISEKSPINISIMFIMEPMD